MLKVIALSVVIAAVAGIVKLDSMPVKTEVDCAVLAAQAHELREYLWELKAQHAEQGNVSNEFYDNAYNTYYLAKEAAKECGTN